MMAVLLLKLQQSVVEGAMEGSSRTKAQESNPEHDSYLAEMLQHLAKETRRNNKGGQPDRPTIELAIISLSV